MDIAGSLLFLVLFLTIIVAPIFFVLYFIYKTVKERKIDRERLLYTIPWAMMLGVVFLALFYWAPVGPGPPEVCTMPAGMGCQKSDLTSSSDLLNITLVNGLQQNIVITNISCSKNSAQSEICDSNRCAGFSGDGVTVSNKGLFSALVACNDEIGNPIKFEPGDAFTGKINVEFYFQDEGSAAKRKMSGNIYVKAK